MVASTRATRGAPAGERAKAEVDPEGPAGREEASCVRDALPAFVFEGPGDQHWIGQRCHVVNHASPVDGLHTVVLTCGCQARVPRSALRKGVWR